MTAAGKFGVLVVEDHPIMRLGIAAIIDAQRDMKVCAQAENGADAVRMFRHHKPDVTLMDLRLPGMSGLDALKTIRRDDPSARCVASVHRTARSTVPADSGPPNACSASAAHAVA